MTARERAIKDGIAKINGKSIYEAYRAGWNDADTFDEAWTEQHPKYLLDRLLADHPEIIEEIKRGAVKEYLKIHQNLAEQDILDAMNQISNNMWKDATSDHFRDSTLSALPLSSLSRKKMMRYEIAKAVAKTLAHRLRIEYDNGWCGDINEQQIAHHSVTLADALIKELEKEEE